MLSETLHFDDYAQTKVSGPQIHAKRAGLVSAVPQRQTRLYLSWISLIHASNLLSMKIEGNGKGGTHLT